MPLIICSFAFNTDNKEGVIIANVPDLIALQILQNLVIARVEAKGNGKSEPVKVREE
uniref:Uncharacterized protein n=1 Tax=viral metagenome TaxID=1070528 RepID=A0A6M3J328_9ZZZZ